MTQLRHLPPVHEVAARLQGAGVPPALCAEAARVAIEERRAMMLGDGGEASPHPASLPRDGGGSQAELAEAITTRAREWLERQLRPILEPAINATGIFLHTGLGRAPLAPEAARAVASAAGGFVPVEIDLESGARGRRATTVEPLVQRLTGAGAATVVNNNAAALTIAIRALATPARPTVVVSRGELIEIGGAFRLPEIIEAAGARLREVGTTNRTRIADYQRAIDPTVCAILKAHPSNYRIEGFTQETSIAELATLARAHCVPLLHDIGSGVLNECMAAWLAPPEASPLTEPIASESLAAGADLVLFSGDKLLGGPQCGIIAGRRDLIAQIERHPLMRALRTDKLTLAALEATLRLHESGAATLPLRRMLQEAPRLRSRAEAIAGRLAGAGIAAEVMETRAHYGAGSAPGAHLPSVAIAIRPVAPDSEQGMAARLRSATPRIFARIESARIILDLAAVFPEHDDALAQAIIAASGAP